MTIPRGTIANTGPCDGVLPQSRRVPGNCCAPGACLLATYAKNPSLSRRPALSRLRCGEERAVRGSTWLAPETKRVVARRHARHCEREACDARTGEMKRAEGDDSAITRRAGWALHKA